MSKPPQKSPEIVELTSPELEGLFQRLENCNLSDNDKHIIAVSTNDDLDQAVVSVRPRPPNNKGSMH